MSLGNQTFLYRATTSIALIVALICLVLFFMGGFGLTYLLPTLAAVSSIAVAIGLGHTQPEASRVFSGAGVVLCGIPLIRDIMAIAGKVPSILLIPPCVLLLLLLGHVLTLFERRSVQEDESAA